MKEIWSKILIIWKDPVWSKVIAAGLIFIIAFIWARFSKYSITDIWNYAVKLLSFRLPIYFILSIVGLAYIIIFFIKFFKRKDYIGNEPMGNFTFKQLYLILQNQNLQVGTLSMNFSGTPPPQENLLILFQLYISYMNTGVTIESHIGDGGYLYAILCPKLISYGLVDKIEIKNSELNIIEIKYQTSELGKKFYSFIEKANYLKKKVITTNKQ